MRISKPKLILAETIVLIQKIIKPTAHSFFENFTYIWQ